MEARIQNAVLVANGKNHSNAEIMSHIVAKTRFGQFKNISDTAVSSQISHILNPLMELKARGRLCAFGLCTY